MSTNILARNNVRVAGRGSHAMLFAHGFGCDQTMWQYVAPEFEDEFRTILFDYVGAGESDLASYDSRRYSDLEGYARDVVEIAETLDLRDAVLVAHSVSCIIGILAARQAPGRFGTLVLIGPSPRYLNDPPHYVGGFEPGDIDGLLDMMDKNYLDWASFLAPIVVGPQDGPGPAAMLEASFCATDPAIAREFANVTFRSDNRQDLASVRVPSLVLQCSNDAIAPDSVGSFVHRQIPGSTFHRLRATGHCPHMSRPQETVAAIKAFLSESVMESRVISSR